MTRDVSPKINDKHDASGHDETYNIVIGPSLKDEPNLESSFVFPSVDPTPRLSDSQDDDRAISAHRRNSITIA